MTFSLARVLRNSNCNSDAVDISAALSKALLVTVADLMSFPNLSLDPWSMERIFLNSQVLGSNHPLPEVRIVSNETL